MIDFRALETQWTPLLRKFASWRIPGMEYEDIMQEMRIVLFNVQRNYDQTKNTKFLTFLYASFLNTALKLLYKSGEGCKPRKGTIPQGIINPLCDGKHDEGVGCSWCMAQQSMSVVDDVSMIDLLSHASYEAQAIAGFIIRGDTNKKGWTNFGLTGGQIISGTRELRKLLKEGG